MQHSTNILFILIICNKVYNNYKFISVTIFNILKLKYTNLYVFILCIRLYNVYTSFKICTVTCIKTFYRHKIKSVPIIIIYI